MCNRLSIGLYRRKLYIKYYVIGWIQQNIVGPVFSSRISYIVGAVVSSGTKRTMSVLRGDQDSQNGITNSEKD